jgi:hypothetical protein
LLELGRCRAARGEKEMLGRSGDAGPGRHEAGWGKRKNTEERAMLALGCACEKRSQASAGLLGEDLRNCPMAG